MGKYGISGIEKRGFEVFYFEGKRKCDFIAKKNGNFLPIQVTYER